MIPQKFRSKVACFGAGFVGIPTSTVLAFHHNDIQFVVYDINKERIAKCQQNKPPIYQKGLEDIMVKVNHTNLRFTHQIGEALNGASVVFLALPTPSKQFGQQKGKAYDLSYTETGIRDIIAYYNQNPMLDHVIIVQKSTVPIGTATMITNIINAVSKQQNVRKYIVASNPEFLAEGSAVEDLMKPDRVVIGSKQNQDVGELVKLYDYVDEKKIIKTNQFSSQLSKLVANCFLAQRVSSINSIAILCEEYQSDIVEVRRCIAADSRIGDKFLMSSVGFGGSCFKKDILALIYLAESKGLSQVAHYWNAVIQMNNFRKKNFFLKVYHSLNNNLKNKKIGIFGTAFKKDTNDARQSPSIQILHYLQEEGAILQIYDPKTTLSSVIQQMKYHNLWSEGYTKNMIECSTAAESANGSHAIVILTEWEEFKGYNYSQFYQLMEKPSYIFDGRSLLQEQSMRDIGFRYMRVGKKFGNH